MNKKLKEGKGESFLHTRKINFKKLNSKKINLLKFIKNIDLNATLMCANNNQAKANGGVLFHKINRIDSNKVKANRNQGIKGRNNVMTPQLRAAQIISPVSRGRNNINNTTVRDHSK